MSLTSLLAAIILAVCVQTPNPDPPNDLPDNNVGVFGFEQVIIDQTGFAYERDVGDIDGDGHNDIIAITDDPPNLLYWFRAPDFTKSNLLTLNPTFHGWPSFRADDIKLADIDGDGDLDVVTRIGDSGDINGKVVWFQNPRPSGGVGGTWAMHDIGTNYYVKDLVVADVDRDGKLDVITREHGATQVWFQNSSNDWTKKSTTHPEREGMDAGDIDGDGDPDVVLNGFWLETPANPRTGTYTQRTIDTKWFNQGGGGLTNSCKVVVADVDDNGGLDVVLSHSESTNYPVSWYSAANPATGPWTEHVIVSRVDYCHNLQALDFNLDGHVDVLTGGMVQSSQRGLTIYLGNGGTTWTAFPVQSLGSYSAEVGDIDDDGDTDIIGIRQYDQAPTEIWRNLVRSACSGGWEYLQVDATRSKWGNFEPPSWLAYFGLGWGDITGDGYRDIVSGRYFYRNPGGAMTGAWARTDLGLNVDGLAMVDVDGDALGDVIGTRGATVYWLEANNTQGTAWTARVIDTTAPTENHVNPQGYQIADIVPGGRPEIILSNSDQVFYYAIPAANPDAGSWPRTMIVNEANAEGIGVADMDRDGLLDIVVAHFPTGSGSTGPRQIKWAKNPGNGTGNWTEYIVGTFPGAWPDRVAAADLNGDQRADIVVAEETSSNNASTYWFEAPADPTQGNWTRRLIVNQYTTNSMDVADIDQDGDIDIILCEHRSANNNEKLAIWKNDGGGNFTQEIIDQGKEGHLGARVADLDNDGDLEIMNIAFDDYQFLHLWRNDNCGGGGATNKAPAVSAGPDKSVTLPNAVAFNGTVSDDGLPNPPGSLTISWSKVSGPGTVTFGTPNAASTTAQFNAAGTYFLRLQAYDGALTTSDNVSVVASAAPTNQPPVVNAGPDKSVTLPTNVVSLEGSASDDGLPNPPGVITVSWTKVSGPGTVAFANPSSAATTAQFGASGAYVLQLSANDTQYIVTDPVNVTVQPDPSNDAPIVGIDAVPSYFIIPEEVFLLATVTDDGRPNPPGAVGLVWSKTSGPGNVFFNHPTAASTNARFSKGGEYVLQLSASDGDLVGLGQVAVTVIGSTRRVTEGLTVFYPFDDGAGRFIRDTSHYGNPLDLAIQDEKNVTWGPGTLTLDAPTAIFSPNWAFKVHQAVTTHNEITVEAWVRPAVSTVGDPASVVLLPVYTTQLSHFGMDQLSSSGQTADILDARLRTTTTNELGEPGLTTPPGAVTTGDLMHLVYTRDTSGTARIIINNIEQVGELIGGNLSNWTNDVTLLLANSVHRDKPWLGTFHLVAVYARALPPLEIAQNYLAGPDPPSGSVADLDGDKDVDYDDMQILFSCTTAPAVRYDPNALPAGCDFIPDSLGVIQPDLDRDRDIDIADFGLLQRCLSGPGWLADLSCAD